MIHVDDLELFLSIFRLGSVGAAAKELERPHQTARDRLSAMENFADCELFDRTPNGVTPNEYARRLEPYARQALDTLLSGLRHMRTGRSPMDLQIALHTSAAISGTRVVNRALDNFEKTLVVSDLSTRDLLASVQDLKFDFAFGPFNEPPPGIQCISFGWEELVCVVAPKHPLAELAVAYLSDLDGYHVLVEVWDDGRLSLEYVGTQVQEHGLTAPDETVRFVAHSSVDEDIAAGLLTPILIVDLPRWSRELQIAFRTDVNHAAALRALRAAAPAEGRRYPNLWDVR